MSSQEKDTIRYLTRVQKILLNYLDLGYKMYCSIGGEWWIRIGETSKHLYPDTANRLIVEGLVEKVCYANQATEYKISESGKLLNRRLKKA
jgi:hypothetical protein